MDHSVYGTTSQGYKPYSGYQSSSDYESIHRSSPVRQDNIYKSPPVPPLPSVYSNTSPKPFGSSTSPQPKFSTFTGDSLKFGTYKSPETGADSSLKRTEFSNNAYKTPDGYRSNTYKSSDSGADTMKRSEFSSNAFKTSEGLKTDGYKASETSFTGDSLKFGSFKAPETGTDGMKRSDFSSNTYKTPEGYRTDTYKYEYYQSEPQTTYSSSSEKYFTTTRKDDKGNVISQSTGFIPSSGFSPSSGLSPFKNGLSDQQHQSSYTSNVEYKTEPLVLRDDSLEQKMLKKSISEQVFEKKTTTTSRTMKQETQMKTFKFP